MNKIYTKLIVLFFACCLGWMEGIAQPWTYNFGTDTSSYTTNNSASTDFLNNLAVIPANGGTYRVRRSNNQGGGFKVANPGTSLGTGSELQIQAASGGSSNKFTVYGWSSPSNTAYIKFKMRTNSTTGGFIGFHLGGGAANPFQDGNSYTSYANSITAIQINYSSGAISSVVRRNNSSNMTMSTHGFLKNTDQEIEIYANNATSATTYNRGGTDTLNARSWSLWVDGVKISPSGGFFTGAGLAGNSTIGGFGFFAESDNNAYAYLDDFEYSNSLPLYCAAPTETPEGFNDFSTPTENSIELEWLDGNGAGRVIKMNTTNSFTDLSKGANPTASTVYSSGEQVVYKGTGSSPIVITGLLPNTTYYFKGYEYCSPDTIYNNSGTIETVTTDIGSTIILTDQTSFGPFCNGTSHSINVGFDETGTFNENFKVQISNSSGMFSTNLNDNIIGTGNSSPISATIPVDFSTGSGYRVRVVNTDPLTVGDDNGSDIVINATPTTPAGATPAAVCEGSSVNITAAGSVNATSYTFWDAVSGGAQITSGVSGNTLTTPNNLTPGNHSYFIQAENGSCSSLTRQEVVVTINTVPASPSGSFIYSANPSCGPAAIGYDAGYYFQTSAPGTSIANPTSSSYTLNSSGTVYVRAYNGSCWSDAVASNAVTVTNPISVTTQPVANISVPENGSGTLSVIAANVSAYQWQENNGSGWSNITDSTASTLRFNNPTPGKNGYSYRVVMTAHSPCINVTSSSAVLAVTAALADSIWSNPIDGSSALIVSGYKTGQDTSENATYSGLVLVGALKTAANDRFNSNTWSATIDTGKYFSWTLTPKAGYELSLESLKFNIQSSGSGPNYIEVRTSSDNYASVIYTSSQVQNQTRSHTVPIGVNNTTGSVTVRLYASGGSIPGGALSVNDFALIGIIKPACIVATPSGSFSYSANPSCGPAIIGYTSGYYFQTSATGTSISAPTSSPYTLNSSGTVYVRAYNGTCWSDSSVASNAVIITNTISVSKQPQSRLVSSTGSGTMSVTATNVQSYQWQENDGTGWSNISGATTSSLVFTNPAQSKSGYTYRVIMTGNSPCGNVTSSAATLTVVTPSGPCSAPSGLSTNVAGGQVTFNWTGTEGADIHAILLTDVTTNNYSKGFSPTASGFTAAIPSGTYKWRIISLCNTEQFVTENASQWISGTQFTVP